MGRKSRDHPQILPLYCNDQDYYNTKTTTKQNKTKQNKTKKLGNFRVVEAILAAVTRASETEAQAQQWVNTAGQKQQQTILMEVVTDDDEKDTVALLIAAKADVNIAGKFFFFFRSHATWQTCNERSTNKKK